MKYDYLKNIRHWLTKEFPYFDAKEIFFWLRTMWWHRLIIIPLPRKDGQFNRMHVISWCNENFPNEYALVTHINGLWTFKFKTAAHESHFLLYWGEVLEDRIVKF